MESTSDRGRIVHSDQGSSLPWREWPRRGNTGLPRGITEQIRQDPQLTEDYLLALQMLLESALQTRWPAPRSELSDATPCASDGAESTSCGSASFDSDGHSDGESESARSQQSFHVHTGGATARSPVTTLVVYGIPESYTQDRLLEQWQPDGSYDFLHLRWKVSGAHDQRMAVINFVHPQLADAFRARWHGRFLGWCPEALAVEAFSVQGRDANMMLVLDGTPVAPVLVDGGEVLSGEGSMERVRLAKRGIFLQLI